MVSEGDSEFGSWVLRKEDCASSECGCDVVVNVVRPSQVSSPKEMSLYWRRVGEKGMSVGDVARGVHKV